MVGFVVSYYAPHFVPYLGFFPYREILTDYHLPTWISSAANFDGIHYMLISQQGYSQWEQAYFPLYPLLMAGLNLLTHNPMVSGLLIANVSFLGGLMVLKKLLTLWGYKPTWVVLSLLSFPTAFFFGVLYTEGLFFLLFVSALYFLETKQYAKAMGVGALAASTRLIGVFLVIPFAFHFVRISHITQWKKCLPLIQKHVAIILSPSLGLIAYCLYLWKTVGDPLYFFHAQPVFGAHRSTHLVLLPQVYYRYIKILLTAAHDFQWYVSFGEIFMFTLVAGVLLVDFFAVLRAGKNRTLLGLNLFSFVNILLPPLTGTFSSIPRYALFSLSLFLCVARIQSPVWKWVIVAIGALGEVAVLVLFTQGYFIG